MYGTATLRDHRPKSKISQKSPSKAQYQSNGTEMAYGTTTLSYIATGTRVGGTKAKPQRDTKLVIAIVKRDAK